MSAIDWMMQQFPNIKERDDMRRIIGRYGLSGQQQVAYIFIFIQKLYGTLEVAQSVWEIDYCKLSISYYTSQFKNQ